MFGSPQVPVLSQSEISIEVQMDSCPARTFIGSTMGVTWAAVEDRGREGHGRVLRGVVPEEPPFAFSGRGAREELSSWSACFG